MSTCAKSNLLLFTDSIGSICSPVSEEFYKFKNITPTFQTLPKTYKVDNMEKMAFYLNFTLGRGSFPTIHKHI